MNPGDGAFYGPKIDIKVTYVAQYCNALSNILCYDSVFRSRYDCTALFLLCFAFLFV